MIIYGWRGVERSKLLEEQVYCPKCANHESSGFGVIKYFHIYWIPLFPFHRKLTFVCTKCEHVFAKDDVPRELFSRIKGEIFPFKSIVGYFTGLIMMLALASVIAFFILKSGYDQDSYLESPKVQDTYIVNFARIFPDAEVGVCKYGALRCSEVNGDELTFTISETIYEYESDVEDNLNRTRFTDFVVLSKKELIEIGAIKEVIRP